MKNSRTIVLISVSALLLSTPSYAQAPKAIAGYAAITLAEDSIERSGYKLVFTNNDSAFDMKIKQRMIDAFFSVYPPQVKRFNTSARKRVVFMIDTAYKGVAGTHAGIVRYNPEWFHKHPGDIDVVTHEVMHIVQEYPRNAGPGWLTEGIADYVRYKYGVDNPGGGWSLTPFSSSHSYKNSYRITARFLVWLEKNIRSTIVDELDTAMRSKTYSPDTWKKLTEKTIDELWEEYARSPALD